eukprot:COSAG06_NODE_12_length_35417_cov_270.698992_8_plen_99_part_00
MSHVSSVAAAAAVPQTWEENRHLDEKPWDGRVLCRGLEFSSYAFATDRKTVRTFITANCIIIAQIFHFSPLFSAAILQIAPAPSDFQSEIGRLLCNSQ